MVYPNDFLQGNLGRFWYFDVSKGPGEKNPVFQGCAKVVCFPAWLGQSALKGKALTFCFTNGVNHVTHLLSLGGWSPVLMSVLNICDFWDPQAPKIARKWPKITARALSGHFGPFWVIFGPSRSTKIRTGLRQPKLRRFMTWLTPFVKKS